MSSATTAAADSANTPAFCDRGACDIAERVDIWELGRKVGVVHGHPPLNREPGILNHFRHAVNGDPDEQVVWHASAAREPGLSAASVEFGDKLVGHILDPALLQSCKDALRNLFRDRDRRRHRADHADLHDCPDSPLHEVIVQQERTLERSGRALEGMTQACQAAGVRRRPQVVPVVTGLTSRRSPVIRQWGPKSVHFSGSPRTSADG